MHLNETNVDPITLHKQTIPSICFHKLPNAEFLKINIIKDLTDAKFGICQTSLDHTQIDAILNDICCNYFFYLLTLGSF